MKSGLAEFLIISPAREKQLEKYEHENGKVFKTRYFIENKARSTFENAIYTRKIIDKHNGFMELESEVGKGTTFTIKLPLISD